SRSPSQSGAIGSPSKEPGGSIAILLVKELLSPYISNVNGTLFFEAGDTNGGGLWRSGGTTAGIILVKDIHPGPPSSHPSSLADVNGTLFFTADDGTHGRELWQSDGTAAGTTLVKDIYPGTHPELDVYGNWWDVPNSSDPQQLTNVNGTLFFTA